MVLLHSIIYVIQSLVCSPLCANFDLYYNTYSASERIFSFYVTTAGPVSRLTNTCWIPIYNFTYYIHERSSVPCIHIFNTADLISKFFFMIPLAVLVLRLIPVAES